MSGLETLQSVQYVTVKGQRLAIIDLNDWEALLEWLESLEDRQIAQSAFAELKKFQGNPKQAGWLKWDEVN